MIIFNVEIYQSISAFITLLHGELIKNFDNNHLVIITQVIVLIWLTYILELAHYKKKHST